MDRNNNNCSKDNIVIGKLPSCAQADAFRMPSLVLQAGSNIRACRSCVWERASCCAVLPHQDNYLPVCAVLQHQLRKSPADVLQDLLKFYFFAFLLQLCIFMLYVSKANKHPASLKDTARSIVTRVVDVFIAAAPTGAPTVIVAALTYCILHLKSEGLVILLPEKIKTIADVEVVCFDKTGTLTGSLVSPCLHVNALICPPLFPLALPIILPITCPG